MSKPALSKEEFVHYLDRIKECHRFDTAVSSLARKYHMEFADVCTGELGIQVIELLERLMGCWIPDVSDDVGGDIYYFCYELDFGRLYSPGMVTDKNPDGTTVDVDFSSAEKLYDYLTRNMGDQLPRT